REPLPAPASPAGAVALAKPERDREERLSPRPDAGRNRLPIPGDIQGADALGLDPPPEVPRGCYPLPDDEKRPSEFPGRPDRQLAPGPVGRADPKRAVRVPDVGDRPGRIAGFRALGDSTVGEPR